MELVCASLFDLSRYFLAANRSATLEDFKKWVFNMVPGFQLDTNFLAFVPTIFYLVQVEQILSSKVQSGKE